MGLFSSLFSDNHVDKQVKASARLIRGNGPAVDLNVSSAAGSSILAPKYKAAEHALSQVGLHGIRAQAVCVLDYSGSMYSDYNNGSVQTLVERFLAFALQIDADGEVPVIPFASRRLPTINVNLQNFQGIVQKELVNKHGMGSTNLAHALEEVRNLARTSNAPLFVGVVTDGNPDSQEEATKIVCDLANYPVFIKFLALREVPYLQELDDLDSSYRLLDNVDTKFFPNLSMTDDFFAQAMADEWDTWVDAALRAGILI